MFDVLDLFRTVRKHITAKDALLIATLIGVYLATRLINLDKFPIFTDEGIYVHWAKIAWKDASMRFISLTDGKQPLHTWGMIPFLKLFSDNLLLGGRLFSVLSGAAAGIGVVTTAWYLFGKRAGYIAGVFYIFTPMFLFYDRVALADSAVNAGFIWVFFGSILLARTLRLDVALLYGLAAGLALLTKSSSQLFIALSSLAPLLTLKLTQKHWARRIGNYFVLYGIGAAIAFVIYNVQRLSPYLHYVAMKNNTFVMSFQEFKETPFLVLGNNIPLIPYYVASEMAYFLFAIGVVGLIACYRVNKRLAFYITLWIIIAYGGIALMAKVIFPRYLIFFATLLTLTAAYFVASKTHRSLRFGLLLAYALSVLYFNGTILFAPARIPFPEVDRGQYIESFNAGWGITDIIAYARNQARVKPVILIGEGNFGVVSDMLQSSLSLKDNITVRGYWPLTKADLIANQTELDDKYVYIVFSHRTEFPADWPMKRIATYPKPGNKFAYYLYELQPSNEDPSRIPQAPR